MFLISWIITALCIAIVSSAHINEDSPNHISSNVWAVLVAGSNKWARYRHQSNVCHAYHLLKKNGIPENRIITFMYDDIANNINNPEPGVIRNEPDGPNVYEGVKIDYSGNNVSKEVLFNVLQGHSKGVKGIGSERVVLSTSRDNIFIFHTGLGCHNGCVTLPSASGNNTIYGKELISVFQRLRARNAYRNILMYLESSHSGAVFENATLPHNMNVLAITAGGPDEDTWGTWCSTKIEPCLAGLFSYSWMNIVENTPLKLRQRQSVFDHYDDIRNDVAQTNKEHPQIYGDWKVGMLPISTFIGYQNYDSSDSKPEKKYLNHNMFRDNKFDKDTVLTNTINEVVTNENEKNNLQQIIDNIAELVIPSEHMRTSILKRISTGTHQNQCAVDLLSLFKKKCKSQDFDLKAHQNEINILANLCDISVINIQQMTAFEAVEKTCI